LNSIKTRLSIALTFGFLTVASHATPITVPNYSFESATLPLAGNGTFNQLIAGSTIFTSGGTLDSWVASSTTINAAAGAFSPSPGGNNWTSTWWQGNNIGYLQLSSPGSASLSDALSATLDDSTTYTLTVDIGSRSFTPVFNYAIELWAGSTLLESASNLSLAPDTSGTDHLTYSSGSSNPLAGQNLGIELVSTYSGGFTEAFFDNVRLDASSSSAVPDTSSFTVFPIVTALLIALKCVSRKQLSPA
jgi:hypothetical protein